MLQHVQSHKSAMLNTKELSKIKDALPDGGMQEIADSLNIHKETVRRVLKSPASYRKDVIDTAIQLVKDFNAAVEVQKQEIKAL